MMDRISGASKNTQQGPQMFDNSYSEYLQKITISMNSNMLLEDLCIDFSIALCKNYNDRNFYKINENKALFENIYGYDFLRYNFDKLISNITRNLVVFGKAYIERVNWYDDNNNLIRITYECINCKCLKEQNKNLVYKLKSDDGTCKKGKISTENFIQFKLSDMGYSKRFFLHKIKKLKKIERPSHQLSMNKSFDFFTYQKMSDYYLLSIMKDIYWNVRNGNNQYINEPYLIYRTMMFEKLQNRFLEYIVSKINNDMANDDTNKGFKGEIVFDSITENYDTLLEQLKNGTKNCEEIGNVIFKRL